MKPSLRLLLACAALAAALAVSGCGNRVETRTLAETEGIYVDVGELKYQIQISRVLNPGDIEDQDYLIGLPEGVTAGADESWFAVFLRVQNATEDQSLPTATEFEIVDTQENVFRPVPLAEENVFAYRAGELAPGALEPDPISAASYNPTQGALLLFRVKTESLANRPMEFVIRAPGGGADGIIDVDV